MTTDHVTSTSDYLQSTDSVLLAGRRLRRYLAADRPTQEYAITALERAAQQQDRSGAAYQAFMFSALESTPVSEVRQRERIAVDALASVLNDFNVANVLIASGNALGESEQQSRPQYLDEALIRLDQTKSAIEQSLATPLSTAAQPGRFGFEATPGSIPTTSSADVPKAVEALQSNAATTIDGIVEDTKGAIVNVLDALSKIDGSKVLEALGKLGDQLEELPRVGRLVRQGIEKFESAIRALNELLNSDVLKQIKAKVEEIWNGIREGTYIAEFLEQIFATATLRAYVGETLQLPNLTRDSLDAASNELARLLAKFKENNALFGGILSAVTFGGTVLALIPVLGTKVVLLTALVDLMILAAILLNGMDYTDAAQLIERVRGVRQIVGSVRLAGQ